MLEIVVESPDSTWTKLSTIATLLAVGAALGVALYDKRARDRDARQRFAIERLLELSGLVGAILHVGSTPPSERIRPILMLLRDDEVTLTRAVMGKLSQESRRVLIARLDLRDDDLVLLDFGSIGSVFEQTDMQLEIADNINARFRG